jgi:hypothetical protein
VKMSGVEICVTVSHFRRLKIEGHVYTLTIVYFRTWGSVFPQSSVHGNAIEETQIPYFKKLNFWELLDHMGFLEE